MLDATSGVTEQDVRIAAMVESQSRSAVIVINKTDLLSEQRKRARKLCVARVCVCVCVCVCVVRRSVCILFFFLSFFVCSRGCFPLFRASLR
jgi:hypothetical protein